MTASWKGSSYEMERRNHSFPQKIKLEIRAEKKIIAGELQNREKMR